MNWAKENAAASGLADRPVRWLVDDCIKFVQRELRRGSRYEAVIMSCLDGYTTCSLFGSFINMSEIDELVARARNSLCQNFRDSSGQRRFAVIDMELS